MLSDEEKEEAWSETEIRFRADLLILNSEFPTHRKTEAMEELLEIYNKQSKEIEEYKKQLDLDYVDNHFVPIERYNQLEKEIEDNKKYIDLHYVPYEQYISKLNELNKKWKDKIKAKIQEVKQWELYNMKIPRLSTLDERLGAKIGIKYVLQSLLEKE